MDELVTFVDRLDARLDQSAKRGGGSRIDAGDLESGLVLAALELRPARLSHKIDLQPVPLERDRAGRRPVDEAGVPEPDAIKGDIDGECALGQGARRDWLQEGEPLRTPSCLHPYVLSSGYASP